MTLLGIGIERALDIVIKGTQNADPRQHRWPQATALYGLDGRLARALAPIDWHMEPFAAGLTGGLPRVMEGQLASGGKWCSQ
jgi:hypothetical protein